MVLRVWDHLDHGICMCVRCLLFNRASTIMICSTLVPCNCWLQTYWGQLGNHGAIFGMNLQFTPSWFNTALTSFDEDRDFSPSAADWKIVILSEISWDVNLHPTKQWNARINVSTNRFRSVITSRCITLPVVQVNKHMYTSVSSLLWCIYRAPVKLTPITQKGCMSCVLNLGSEAG